MSSEGKHAASINPFAVREQLNSKHLFESGTFSLYDEGGFVNLTAGAPGPDLLAKCCDIFDVATRHRMNEEKNDQAILFQYGAAIGRSDFHAALSEFLTEKYHDDVNCHDLVLTTGATQGLHNALTVLVDLNGVVFVDEVTYMIALEVMAHFPGLRIVTVPLTADGVDVKLLRRLVAEHRFESAASKPFWGMYYTIPVHHNPTGMTFSSEVCREIVNIAREFELLVFAEDVYNMLTYSVPADGSADTICAGPPKRLFAYDRMEDAAFRGNVISNGTFSKILSPGIRVGWMEVPPRCMRSLNASGVLRSGGASNNYTSGIVTTLLQLNLAQDLLRDNLQVYGDRMRMACSLLRNYLPPKCLFTEPTGGYFIWITLPPHVDVDQLNAYSREHHQVAAIAGHVFSAGGAHRNCIRLSIAFHRIERLETALLSFCTAVAEFLAK